LGGAVERSPTSGKINDLQKVRVEIAALNAKEDFAATRTSLAGAHKLIEADGEDTRVTSSLTMSARVPGDDCPGAQ
jgi:hypothetical protein